MTNTNKRSLVFTLVLAGCALLAAAAAEVDALRGTWKLTGGELAGRPLPAKVLAGNHRLAFDGDKLDMLADGEPNPSHFTVKVDATADPKQIDLTDLAPDSPDQAVELGIYKVDGDTLTLCLARPGGKVRPTEFKSADRSVMVRVYTRVKP